MSAVSIPLAGLLPHGPQITVIDRLVACDAGRAVAVVDVTERSLFFESSGVPAWVGIEYMAQTIAAHAGFSAKQRGEPAPLGFLLGTRRYECSVPVFRAGLTLVITVEPLAVDTRFGAFSCEIAADGIVATAVVNTYRPSDAEVVQIRAKLTQ